MSSLFRMLFWFWYPDPKIGEKWTHEYDVNDPWNTFVYTVTKQQGNWFRLRAGHSWEESKHKSVLIAFYRKTGDAPEDDDDPVPF